MLYISFFVENRLCTTLCRHSADTTESAPQLFAQSPQSLGGTEGTVDILSNPGSLTACLATEVLGYLGMS